MKGNQKFREIGAKLRKGILLYGPSGTGKTLLAKAIAGECGANFVYRSGSEFIDKYVGIGAKRVRETFNLAKKLRPCIIFIDEIDALGKRQRSYSNNYRYNMDRTNTINQFLTELDGFKNTSEIVVIAATNNP